MNQGPISGRFMKKTRGQKSRATVPLRDGSARFIDSNFFHGSTLYGAKISMLKLFRFLFRIRDVIGIFEDFLLKATGGIQDSRCSLQRLFCRIMDP